MIEGMRERIDAIVLEKCKNVENESGVPKVTYMSAGGRIFGDGVGELVVWVEETMIINFEELKEKVLEIISEYGFEIVSTEVSSGGISRGTTPFKFLIKYKEKQIS